MQELPRDALQGILGHLTWQDLLAASSSCRLLRTAAAPHSQLWERQCLRRWHGPLNTSFLPRPPAATSAAASPHRANYKAVFLRDNGWHDPVLDVQQYAGSSWSDELVAVHPTAHNDGSATIAVSSCRELRLMSLGSSPTARLHPEYAGVHSTGPGSELWASVAAIPARAAGAEGLLAAGGCHGRLTLWQLPECSTTSPRKAAGQPAATMAFPGNSCVVSQIHHLPQQQHVAVLHDSLAVLRGAPQRSMLSVVDIASWRQVAASMNDVLEGYQLAAVAPVGAAGCEFIAGSVKLSDDQESGWACRQCAPAAPAALCFHKSPASAAALCVFDCRSPGGMVARYATHHRSLYPHLEALRGHFLLTSHAGTPVACWDRRQMNGPVHEVQHLPRQLPSHLAPLLSLESPDLHERPASQALHLSATPDLLLGRADNGMCWLFDLSERLGWADGSHPGSWLQPAQAMQRQASAAAAAGAADGGEGEDEEMLEGCAVETGWGEQGYLDESDFERGPLPLGCIGAPYEVWCPDNDEAPPLHWLPPTAAWVAHNRLIALGGLELEQKQQLFPAYKQGSPYPSNALVVASLQPPRDGP